MWEELCGSVRKIRDLSLASRLLSMPLFPFADLGESGSEVCSFNRIAPINRFHNPCRIGRRRASCMNGRRGSCNNHLNRHVHTPFARPFQLFLSSLTYRRHALHPSTASRRSKTAWPGYYFGSKARNPWRRAKWSGLIYRVSPRYCTK